MIRSRQQINAGRLCGDGDARGKDRSPANG